MNYVILSTDNNPDYYSLLPLVCYSWKKIGYKVAVCHIGVEEKIREILPAYCPDVYWLGQVNEMPYLIKNSTIAQVSRLFAHRMFADNDELVIGDADMVIAKDIFVHDGVVSYGFDLTGRSEIPMCYFKAPVSAWREIIGDTVIQDLPKAQSNIWEVYWNTDQELLTRKAHEYGMSRITFVDRGNQNKHGLPTSRWDRHDWAHIPDSIIDVHMKRGDWQAQIDVFQRLWPGEDYSFILKFKEALDGAIH